MKRILTLNGFCLILNIRNGYIIIYKKIKSGGRTMAKGNMNARERIEYLLDDNSFVEIGKYVTARKYRLQSKL